MTQREDRLGDSHALRGTGKLEDYLTVHAVVSGGRIYFLYLSIYHPSIYPHIISIYPPIHPSPFSIIYFLSSIYYLYLSIYIYISIDTPYLSIHPLIHPPSLSIIHLFISHLSIIYISTCYLFIYL